MENRFMVPQYIEVEAKILGPITVRQFIVMLVAAMNGFIVWKIFELRNQTLGLILTILIVMIYVVFAFAKVNGQNFHYFVLNIIRTFKRPQLKVWKKTNITALPKEPEPEPMEVIARKKLPTKARLSDLALLVDTGGAYNVDLEAKNGNGNGNGVKTQEKTIEEMNI